MYIYSSIHIAFCTVFMVWQTDFFKGEMPTISPYITVVFLATILIYSLHKIIGASRITKDTNSGRIKLFKQYRNHLLWYSGIVLLILAYFVFQLSWNIILLLTIPGILSLLYISPLFYRGRRLRDLDYIKIFLIAIVWTLIVVVIPLWNSHHSTTTIALLGLEKCLFMLAITLPFDIRDIEIDEQTELKTIAKKLGAQKVKYLAGILLFVAFGLSGILFISGIMDLYFLLIIGISYILSFWMIHVCTNKKHDFYFSGILDGTMMIPFVLLLLYHLIF